MASLQPSAYPLGTPVIVPAAHFTEKWAKQEYGTEWESTRLTGHVVGFTAAKPTKRGAPGVDLWHVKCPGDSNVYKWMGGVLKELAKKHAAEQLQQEEDVDLRTQVRGVAANKSKQSGCYRQSALVCHHFALKKQS